MSSNRVLTVALLLSTLPASTLAHTIVVFGDSVTAPRRDTEIYSDILARDLLFDAQSIDVVNAGVGGNTTAMALRRFDRDVLQKNPDTVVLMFGINDASVDVWKKPPATRPRVALEAYKTHLANMIRSLKERGVRVVLMTPNPLSWTATTRKLYSLPPYQPDVPDGMNVLLHDYVQVVRDLANTEKVGLVDVFELFKNYVATPSATYRPLTLDGIHPVSEGHLLIAAALTNELTSLDSRFSRKPDTLWVPSGDVNELHPLATDVSHDAPGPAVLGPALVQLSDGAIMSIYSTPTSYAGEPGGCFIAGRLTRDGGKTWGKAQELSRLPNGRAAHPTILRAKDGTLHMFFLGFVRFEWDSDHINPTERCRSDLWTTRSANDGVDWSEPQMIFKGYSGSTNGAAETSDGRIVVPFSCYVAGPGRFVAKSIGSGDGGRTWQPSNTLDIGGAGDHDGAMEPCIIELKDGRLWMLIRTTRGAFWQSYSADGGRNWSTPTRGPIDSANAPAHLARLADGRIAMAWNRSKAGRSRLHLSLSNDEGKTWTPSFIAVRGSSAYPFILETEPGELWVGYIDAHQGWETPRARHFKIMEKVLLEGRANAR